MKAIWLSVLTVAMLSMMSVNARAQGPGSGRGPGNFERAAPRVGQQIPDIQALDADGKPIQLSSLKGHYTVLVFGCLT